RSEPKTFNPILVTDDSSEAIRYLTGGVLIRVNRLTQELVPELATSWKVLERGRKISFNLREGIAFSDGTPFSAADVAFTIRTLMDPAMHSPTSDSFRSGSGTKKEGGCPTWTRFDWRSSGTKRLKCYVFDGVSSI